MDPDKKEGSMGKKPDSKTMQDLKRRLVELKKPIQHSGTQSTMMSPEELKELEERYKALGDPKEGTPQEASTPKGPQKSA